MSYFILYSCCIPIKGVKRAIISDLQRDKFDFIPNALYALLVKFSLKKKTIESAKEFFNHQYDETIDNYLNFLIENEYGFLSDTYLNLPQIRLSEYNEPKRISNSIVDFSKDSTHQLKPIITQLSLLMCEALEIRFFFPIRMDDLTKYLTYTNGSSLRSVEILLEYHDQITIEILLKLRNEFTRLRKITIYCSPMNKIFEHEEVVIIFTMQNVDEGSCGVCSPWYFISKTETFIEFNQFNSCLNKKISVDSNGNIKNCPSMSNNFGSISKVTLVSVLDNRSFTSLWTITKDKINTCKKCEFRYICQDCRAFIENPDDIYSKPLKCQYNPLK